MEQTERLLRVERMERAMDACIEAAGRLEQALADWEAVQPELETLRAYYESPQWLQDFEADEAGAFPPELKRGVLSEDGLSELLDRAAELSLELR